MCVIATHFLMHSNKDIIDFKTVFRTQKCAEIILNKIHFDPNEFLSSPQFLKIASLEAIYVQL